MKMHINPLASSVLSLLGLLAANTSATETKKFDFEVCQAGKAENYTPALCSSITVESFARCAADGTIDQMRVLLVGCRAQLLGTEEKNWAIAAANLVVLAASGKGELIDLMLDLGKTEKTKPVAAAKDAASSAASSPSPPAVSSSSPPIPTAPSSKSNSGYFTSLWHKLTNAVAFTKALSPTGDAFNRVQLSDPNFQGILSVLFRLNYPTEELEKTDKSAAAVVAAGQKLEPLKDAHYFAVERPSWVLAKLLAYADVSKQALEAARQAVLGHVFQHPLLWTDAKEPELADKVLEHYLSKPQELGNHIVIKTGL